MEYPQIVLAFGHVCYLGSGYLGIRTGLLFSDLSGFLPFAFLFPNHYFRLICSTSVNFPAYFMYFHSARVSFGQRQDMPGLSLPIFCSSLYLFYYYCVTRPYDSMICLLCFSGPSLFTAFFRTLYEYNIFPSTAYRQRIISYFKL
ncbi:hypothetical protein BCR34DRAFT_100983 [Clohesyomyces aquaticus]|uniref:Uncharacterized protein n=1 Tax=Clohesyomyces aquaticus TaxID=1231657 RepID=A0A1Y1YSM5_9PLEO|nr:hypothetical protein BCR34DRAFT_100983 [Clohesyomyces aquaticus]